MFRAQSYTVLYEFVRSFADVVKRCLELSEDYDLILNKKELEMLSDYVKLLDVFNIFTVYVQAKNYPTMNSIMLFRSEIIEK